MKRDLAEYIKRNFQKAIDLHAIQAYYQPVIRTSARQLCSFEALARWIDPKIGMIFPDEFIPVLEQEGLIHLLDAAILRRVCAQLRSSLTNGSTPIPVSVNLSRLDFALCDIFSVVDDIVSDYQIPHDFLYFEITESVMAEQMDVMQGIVDRFHAAGYQIWMDDFGSAYSSLNALKELSFEELKLDMCFLRPFNLRSRRITTAVVEMAKSIGIHTLAEGVETEEQYAYLRDIGCEKVQGYFFGKPLPYEKALENLREKGIAIEPVQDRQYYDEIGKLDFLSAVPFMTQEEHDAIDTARLLNSIPLSLVEFSEKSFKVLFYNTAFETTAPGAGMLPDIFSQEMLGKQQPFERFPDKLIQLMDFVRTNGDGRMLVTFNEQYFEIQARNVAKTRDRYCVLLRITNLTKASQSETTGYLDDFLRRIYALYERITLVNVQEDSIRPLYTLSQEDLLSGRKGLSKLFSEYVEKYVYPDDREEFLRIFAPETVFARFRETGRMSLTEPFRTSVLHGQYAWKEYTLLKIDDDNYFLLVRNVHENICQFHARKDAAKKSGGGYTPEQLWNNLLRSNLLSLFWKDENRRFLGANKAFLDYYGFSSVEEILGKNDEDLGWHVHPDLFMNDEYKVIHEGETLQNMPGLCMNGGETREILASKTPLYNDNGEIRGLLGYFIDKEALTANDRHLTETRRRDILTGLLNSRGISEEASIFRDEYYLRGTDFVRIHIAVNDMGTLNEQYGFDFGDRVLKELGKALRHAFGRASAVGRYAGNKFAILQQIQSREEANSLRDKIKAIGASIKKIKGVPVTLYLSVGYTLFSEVLDKAEQTKISEIRLHADHDNNISAKSRLGNMADIFRLFDDLPVSYSVYHVTHAEHSGLYDAVIFYVNHKYEEFGGRPAREILGHSTRELYPSLDEEWYRDIKRAAFDGESVEREYVDAASGKRYAFKARQILYPGYCAATYLEV